MKQLCGVHVLDAFQDLVDDVLFVYFLQDACPDDGMQIRLHVLEYQIYVPIILRSMNIRQLDYILVVQLVQEHDLAERSLCIGGVLEGIKYLLQSHGHILVPLIQGLPHLIKCMNWLILFRTLPYQFA